MAEITTDSSVPGTLNPSVPASELSVSISTPLPAVNDWESRFNGTMALYNKEQSLRTQSDTEVRRLQELLATEVTRSADYKAKLAAKDAEVGESTKDLENRASTAEKTMAELTTATAQLQGENTQLKFLLKNEDLIPYASVLPSVANTEQLEAAAATIRQARQAETDSVRNHLTNPSRGGQTPRTTPGKMSASEIDNLLRNAPRDQFERIFKEVTGQL